MYVHIYTQIYMCTHIYVCSIQNRVCLRESNGKKYRSQREIQRETESPPIPGF